MKAKLNRAVCALLVSGLLAGVTALPSVSRAEGPIKQGSLLTLRQCMDIALRTNPQMAAADNTLAAAESRIGEAKSAYYPQVYWQTDYTHFSSSGISSARFASGQGGFAGAGQGSQDNFQTGPALTQNIYDFGKTQSQVEIAKYNRNASRRDFETTSFSIILNVKTAYFGVLQAQKSLEAAKKVVYQAQQHLTQAQGFFEVGTKPKIDVTNAEVTLSNAQLALIQAGNAVQVAWQNLNNAMGIPAAPEYRIEDILAYTPYPITFDEAIKNAYANRPDLKAADARVRSSEQSLRLAGTGYLPAISGSAGYTWSSDIGQTGLDHGWDIGATFTIPIFNGFLTRRQVDEATANINVAKANKETLKQQIYLQNKQAWLNLKQAESSIATAKTGLRQAQENLDLANGRYAAGVGSNIEVTDALTTFTSAQTAYINALYSYKTAEANLENAMGIR